MLYFFTDITTNQSNLCLLNINRLMDKRVKEKFLFMIDPSVYELKKQSEYSKIELLHQLAIENKYLLSIDYPCDMNKLYTELFIEKSIKNNLLYKNNEKYICTIQFKFMNFIDFKRQFEYLEESIDMSKKIVGIGNLCRILFCCEFSNRVFHFLWHKYQDKHYFFHFYGLGMRLIKRYLHLFSSCSIDSTKYTKPVTKELKKQFNCPCSNQNRNLYFLTYINELKKNHFDVIF